MRPSATNIQAYLAVFLFLVLFWYQLSQQPLLPSGGNLSHPFWRSAASAVKLIHHAFGSALIVDRHQIRKAAHSQDEERWFTLGTSSEGKLLAVSHTYHQPEASAPPKVRIISAREVTRRERQQYEDEPR